MLGQTTILKYQIIQIKSNFPNISKKKREFTCIKWRKNFVKLRTNQTFLSREGAYNWTKFVKKKKKKMPCFM